MRSKRSRIEKIEKELNHKNFDIVVYRRHKDQVGKFENAAGEIFTREEIEKKQEFSLLIVPKKERVEVN